MTQRLNTQERWSSRLIGVGMFCLAFGAVTSNPVFMALGVLALIIGAVILFASSLMSRTNYRS